MRGLDDIAVAGKTVFCRVDFNVPLADGRITGDARIRQALPTLRELTEAGARVVVASHLGRPKGQVVESLRMTPVAERLEDLLGRPLGRASVVVGPEADAAKAALADGELLLLDNLRFEPGEQAGDAAFADALARGIDLFVNEAFGACHRADASIVGLPARVPGVAGRLLAREVAAFAALMDAPPTPFVCVLGGAKVSDKLPVIEHLLPRIDRLLIGGGMAYTFLAARGEPIGDSLLARDLLDGTRALLARIDAAGVTLELPVDHVATTGLTDGAQVRTVDRLEPGWMGVDIGPATRERFRAALADAASVVWNGPMGVFERAPFDGGTLAVAQAIADSPAHAVVGGGDSVLAVERTGLGARVGHLSTGGGAALELLGGIDLPGLRALRESRAG